VLLDHLFDPAKQHFNTVLAHLDAFGGVRYVITAARHMRLISTAFAAPIIIISAVVSQTLNPKLLPRLRPNHPIHLDGLGKRPLSMRQCTGHGHTPETRSTSFGPTIMLSGDDDL